MAQTKLPLPDHARTLIFRRLIQFVKANQKFNSVIKTWYTWDGSPDSAAPLSSGQMPAIRFTPVPRGAIPITPVRQQVPFGIAVEITAGTFNADDLFNLWGAFEKSLFPGDGSNSLLSALQNAAVWPQTVDIWLEQPAIGPQKEAVNSEYLIAVGTIVVQILLPK